METAELSEVAENSEVFWVLVRLQFQRPFGEIKLVKKVSEYVLHLVSTLNKMDGHRLSFA